MKQLFTVMLLAILCIEFGTSYPVHAQDTETETPSLPHADAIDQLLNFAEPAEDCTLPCFGGIYPEETTLSEIRDMTITLFDDDEAVLSQFDNPFEREDGLLDYTLRFSSLDVAGSFSLRFLFSPEEHVLRRFHARLNRPENWLVSSHLDISEVLTVLGEPDEVYISISGSEPSYFNMVLGYEALGTLFLYTYFFEPEQITQGEEPIPLCGSWAKTYSIDVWIQAVDEEFYNALLEENLRLSEHPTFGGIVYRAFWSLDRITNWNVEDLTQFISENPEWCFDALSYDALWEAGYSY